MWASVAEATTISYTGNLRTDATVTTCQGAPCTLVTDADYAQYAAVVETFSVAKSSTVEAVTFSYGGGVNALGTTIAAGGFSPYLSLFDAGGNFSRPPTPACTARRERRRSAGAATT